MALIDWSIRADEFWALGLPEVLRLYRRYHKKQMDIAQMIWGPGALVSTVLANQHRDPKSAPFDLSDFGFGQQKPIDLESEGNPEVEARMCAALESAAEKELPPAAWMALLATASR